MDEKDQAAKEKGSPYGENKPAEDVRPDDRDTSKQEKKPDPAGDRPKKDA